MYKFSHRYDGKPIDEMLINIWISNCLEQIEKGKKYTAISSGDTSVIVTEWDTEIEVFVCNRDGVSTLRLPKSEDWKMEGYALYKRKKSRLPLRKG